MTHFGSYLGQIIASDYDGHRTNFAKACNLTPPSISNYLTKGEVPSAASLGRVANAVNDSFKRAELVQEYWRDIQDAAKIVGVEVAIRPSVKATARQSEADEEVRAIIDVLQKRARNDAAFRRILKDIAQW